MYHFMRIESKRDRLQILAFVTIYSLTCSTAYGNLFETSYLINNLILLAVSVAPFFVPDNYKVQYMFGYSCAISAWTDSFIIPFSIFFGKHDLPGVFHKVSFIITVVMAVVFMAVKYIIGISAVQVARHLNNQPELKFRYKLDYFNYTRDQAPEQSLCSKNSSNRAKSTTQEVTVSLSQISPNTTQVNQTNELISQTINNELKFGKHLEIDKHLVPH